MAYRSKPSTRRIGHPRVEKPYRPTIPTRSSTGPPLGAGTQWVLTRAVVLPHGGVFAVRGGAACPSGRHVIWQLPIHLLRPESPRDVRREVLVSFHRVRLQARPRPRLSCLLPSPSARTFCRRLTRRTPGSGVRGGRQQRRKRSLRQSDPDSSRKAQALGRGSPLVFPSMRGKPLADTALSELLRELGIAAVPHGFRSSFRDWTVEETDHPREVVEAALAHRARNQVEAAYRRTDLFERRRRLMDDWAGYLAGERDPEARAIR